MLLVAAALLQAAAAMFAGATPPASPPAPAPVAAAPAPAVSEVVVTADPAGLLERRPTGAVFGLPLPLLETPRSATFVSAQTLDRYGARTVDDLVAVAPGTFTDSYYGVPGALNVRGTLAETYFDGFKRIENRGTYPTLLGSAEEVQIVRGPPTPAFGPGKVGGLLDLVPHSARDPERGWPDAPTGYAEAGGGSYGYRVFDGEVSAPLQLGALPGGGFLYVEAEDGPEYYRGVDPKHLLLQGSVGFDLAPGWRLAVQAEAGRYEGAVQTPGWNRLTQALIDHGTYITGRDTTLKDTNGDGRLQPSEIGPGGLITGYFGFPPAPDPRFTLDTGVGTAQLSRRTVFVSDRDFNDTDTRTLKIDLLRTLGNGDRIALQAFYDDLYDRRFVSYGFPAAYDARVLEGRLSWSGTRDLGPVHLELLAGADARRYSGRQRESSNGGYIALDRRDLVNGPTATDILDDPFSVDGGLTFETDVTSRYTDAGLFGQADARWLGFDLLAGLRGDRFDLASRDDGTLVFGATPGQTYQAVDHGWSGTLSLSYAAPFGLRPYATIARTQALELSQAGGVAPSLIVEGAELSQSYLEEAGLKLRLFGDRLTGAFSLYRQTRTQLGERNAVVGIRGEGAELELRALLTRHWSATVAANLQRTTVRGPDPSFIVVPPSAVGVAPQDGYGGSYAVFAVSTLRPGDYTDTLIPRYVASPYLTWTGDHHGWGQLGATAGFSAIGATAGILPGAVRLPAYVTANGSGFWQSGPWRVTVNVDNLANTLAFTPVADVYAEVAALPIQGRTWRARLRRAF